MISVKGDELYVGGISVSDLVERYGEPIYIYDFEVIQKQYEKLRAALPEEVGVFYSMKANPNVSIVSFLRNLAQGVDVSSLSELYVAQEAGFSPDQILFVGPAKSEEEIKETIQKRIFCLVVESEEELRLANQIAFDLNETANVAIRINPALDVGGPRLRMGGTARQFGIDEETIDGVLQAARSFSHLRITGIHVYLGTRILDYEVAWKYTQYVLELAQRLREKHDVEFRVIDFGGGLGVPYFNGEQEFDIEQFGKLFREYFAEYKKLTPGVRFVMESGRYLVAESGVYVTKVRYVKQSRGQKFAMVGGGLNHHQATTALGSLIKNHFPIEILNKMTWPKTEEVNICGPLCTPTDVLGKSVKMAAVNSGDIIGILNSGAYGLTASPINFLSHSHPAELMVYRGMDFLIRRPSTVADILKNQVMMPSSPLTWDVGDVSQNCSGNYRR